jgi:hypothetical protein
MHIPKPTGGDFELAPAGTHLATCYRIIDLGTQDSTYRGTPKRQHKILITWELSDEKMKDGRPFSVGQRYTWSMSDKAALRRDLENWRGLAFVEKDFGPNGFDIKQILGKSCLLTITHSETDGHKYANVSAVSKLMKGQKGPSTVNEQVYLWIDQHRWDSEIFSKLSEKLKAAIMRSPEYSAMVNGGETSAPTAENPADGMDDEIPF